MTEIKKEIKNFYIFEMLLKKNKEDFYENVEQEFKLNNLSFKTKWWIDKLFNKSNVIDDDTILAIIPILVKDGFLLDFEDANQSYRPLQMSLATVSNLKIVQLLIDFGARVDAVDSFDRTPLFCCQTPEAAKLLLDNGANIEHRNCAAEDTIEYSLEVVKRSRAGQTVAYSEERIETILDTIEFLKEYKKEQFRKRVIGELSEAPVSGRLGGRM